MPANESRVFYILGKLLSTQLVPGPEPPTLLPAEVLDVPSSFICLAILL